MARCGDSTRCPARPRRPCFCQFLPECFGEPGHAELRDVADAARGPDRLIPTAHGFRTITEAIYLRDHIVRQLELAAAAADALSRCAPASLGVAIDEDSNSAAHGDGHGQRDPVRASARLAVTCSILAFSAWQTNTRASCNRRPGSSPGAIRQAERDRGCQDQASWQRHRLLTLETEERGGRHEIRGSGGARRRGRPGQRLVQGPASSRRRYRCNRRSGSRGTGRAVL